MTADLGCSRNTHRPPLGLVREPRRIPLCRDDVRMIQESDFLTKARRRYAGVKRRFIIADNSPLYSRVLWLWILLMGFQPDDCQTKSLTEQPYSVCTNRS